jgi:flagellar export protein FliJ
MAFKFQNILNHRKTVLDKKSVELSEAVKKADTVNLKISEVNGQIESFKVSYPDEVAKVSDIHGYNILDARFESLNSKLLRLLKEKESADRELADKKAAAVKAKMEFEKIDKLREKYLAVDKLNMLKHEEAVAADFASNRYSQNCR